MCEKEVRALQLASGLLLMKLIIDKGVVYRRTNPLFWTLAARLKPWAQRETSAGNLQGPMLSRCIDRAGAEPWLDAVQL